MGYASGKGSASTGAHPFDMQTSDVSWQIFLNENTWLLNLTLFWQTDSQMVLNSKPVNYSSSFKAVINLIEFQAAMKHETSAN